MTETEKRQQQGMALLELKEAERNLAHLREKARRMAEQTDKMRAAVVDVTYANDSEIAESTLTRLASDPEIIEALDVSAGAALAQEMLDARKAIRECSERARSLGAL